MDKGNFSAGSEFVSGSTTKEAKLISTLKHGAIAYTVSLPRRLGRQFPGKGPQQETLPSPRRLSSLRVGFTQYDINVGQLIKTVQNLAEVMVKLLEDRADGK